MDRSPLLTAEVVAPVRVDPRGVAGPTKPQARSTAWRRSSRGLYVPSWVDGTQVTQRVVEAAAVLPRYGGVTGWAGLHLLGGEWFDGSGPGGELPVVLAVGGNSLIRAQAGIMPSEERLRPAEITEVHGVRVTTPARSVCFEMRYAADLRAAVKALDMAAMDDLVSVAEAWDYAVPHLNGWTGVQQCRDAILLAEENSWSPMEVEMRLLWVLDLGLPRPLCNHPVFDLDGRFVGTPDLLDVEAGVVGEYDGALHLEGAQRAADIRREAAFRRIGLEYVTMVAADRSDPSGFLQRTLDARARARRSSGSRQWTVEAPAWWTPTVAVEQRRALSEWQQERYLRRRVS